MIPKRFNFIWLDRGAKFGVIERASIESKIIEYGKDFEYVLWVDDMNFDPNIPGLRVKSIFDVIPRLYRTDPLWNNWIGDHGPAFECDYYRQRLMYRIGGIYSDLDSITLKRLPDSLFEEEYVSCIEKVPGTNLPAGCVIGFFMSAPNSKYLRRFIEKRDKISVDLISNMQLGLTQLYNPLSIKMIDPKLLLPIDWTKESLTEFLNSESELYEFDAYEFHCYTGALTAYGLKDKMEDKVKSMMKKVYEYIY